mmetsp:Transcript_28096/g.40224  ORF Transcript_28096/g.40224 Transcript_28096/m.40224 type:complete len:90 (-) Transcript_28096:707-976(-)
MSSALYAGFIRAPTPGIPENLSIYFIPKRSTSTSTNVSHHLINQALEVTEGSGLGITELKLATKQKITVPSSLLDFIHQMENFKLLLQF